jgi:hypothetical protein
MDVIVDGHLNIFLIVILAKCNQLKIYFCQSLSLRLSICYAQKRHLTFEMKMGDVNNITVKVKKKQQIKLRQGDDVTNDDCDKRPL